MVEGVFLSGEAVGGGSACTDVFFTVRKVCLSYRKTSTEMPTLTLVPVSVWLLASYSVAVNLLLSLKNQKEPPSASGGLCRTALGISTLRHTEAVRDPWEP